MKGRGSLNHLYRLVWSQVQGAWIAVAETTKGRGKGSSRKLLVAAVGLSSALAQAAPEGGQVVSGAGSIAQSGATTTITQASQNLSLNWNSFNIAAQETVNFNQPSATAIAVNRIMDSNGTQILGNLNANGQVYLINPNGILFGQGAQVNVGALVASTLDLNDASLNSDSRSFSGNGAGSVINHGTLNAANGGYVALLGNTVSNQGTISAPGGTVALGAGSAATLTFADNSLVQMQVDQSLLDSLADNGGLIQADGGRVLMSAGAKDALLASVVNNTGVIEARTVENRDGVIVLLGGMQAGTVQVAGTLDASAPNGGNGGFIETSAAHVKVPDNAKITTAAAHGKTGTWLIDPVDFTIAASGGDITGATLSSNLGSTDVLIESVNGGAGTSGDVNVNDVVEWSANKLTLNAENNINVNADMNASGSASLALEFGQAAVAAGNTSNVITHGAAINLPAGTTNFTTKLGSDGTVKAYTVITSLGAEGSITIADLQGMNGDVTLNYALGSNIDASATSEWNAGAGFAPVDTFNGTLDGLGHTIDNLTINRPGTDRVGLFSGTGLGSSISNVGLVDVSVTGNSVVGGLVGGATDTKISNSYATGTVKGTSSVGGLVAIATDTKISNSYATGAVTVTVAGTSSVGGLVARASRTNISNSYATGAVSGPGAVGGLVGAISNTTISNSYATGTVTGTGGGSVGGLVGTANFGNIINSYATGALSGTGKSFGGLVGHGSATINNSFWDTTTSVQTSSAGGTGMTTEQMQTQANFTSATDANGNVDPGWDFADIWLLTNGSKAPLLKALMVDVTVTVDDVTKTYDGDMYRGGYSSTVEGHLPGTLSYTGSALSAVNASSYVIAADAASYANKQYVITAIDGTLTINPADLTLSTSDVSKTYDAGLDAAGSLTVTGGALFGSDSVSGGTFAYTNKNAGTGNKTVSTSGVTVIDGNSGGNYSVSYADNTTSTINKADLSVTGLTVSNKTYDTTANAILGGNAAISKLGSDDVTVIGSASGLFADKSAGTGKVVTVTGNSLSGADADNYTLLQQAGLSADIGKANLSVTGLTAGVKIYDANTTASLGGTAAVTAIDGDSVTLDGTASGIFASKNVGTQNVSVSGNSLSGTDAGNYNLLQQAGLLADISKADLLVSGLTAGDKTYDANTTASLSGSAAVTALGADVVSLGGVASGLFADKNVGTGKAVSVTGHSLSGSDAGNYNLLQQAGLLADIGKADLSVTGLSAGSKTYDATANAMLGGTALVSAFGDDDVSVIGTASGLFADKNVGTGKAVTLSGHTLSGGDAGNYNLLQQVALTANIGKAELSVTGLTAGDKIYDAKISAVLGGSAAVTAFSGDSVTLNGTASGLFADKNVGTGKAVTVTGNTLSGSDAGNYTLLQQAGLSAAIGKANLSVSGLTAIGKVYDANTTASLGGNAAVAAFSGDSVTLNGDARGLFADKNAGLGKAVTVSGNSLSGTDAGNYTLLQQAGLSADISKADLSVTGITADSKVYDGNTGVSLNTAAASLNGLLAGDEVTVSAAGGFDSKNVGAGKTVTLVSRYAGADLGNYRIRDQGSIAADITRATLTYMATPASFFSGQTPGALLGGVSGFVSGETLAASTRGAPIWTTAASVKSQPGVYAINGGGLTASNYQFAQAADNASALTLTPGTAIEPVRNVTAQLAASVLSPQISSQPQALSLSSSISVSRSAKADSGAANESAAADANNGSLVNTQMTIGRAGPSLLIVSGGVRLPDTMVAEK